MKNTNSISRFAVSAAVLAGTIALTVLPAITSAATLTRQLELTMSGPDVSTLQSFLAQDPTMYPQGLVTGYFGFLTKAAVSNFQVRNNIPAVGRVGPITLVAINEQIGVGLGDVDAPIIMNNYVGTTANTATVSWNTNEPAKGLVYYSTSPLSTYENANSVTVSGATAMTDMNLRTSQSVAISGLAPNTLYYYMVYVTDAAGNVSVTVPGTFRSM